MKITKIYAILIAVSLAGFVSCTKKDADTSNNNGPDPSVNKSLTLVTYSSCTELETEVKAMITGEMEKNLEELKNYCRYKDGDVVPLLEPATEDGTAGSDSGATGTNIQEEGVDEADLIKTDGKYVYAIVGDEVKIVRVFPFNEFSAAQTIRPSGQPTGLYLADGKLIVLSDSRQDVILPAVCIAPPGGAETGCLLPDENFATVEEVYDVTNPSSPALIKKKVYSGGLLESRRIGRRLYLIVSDSGVVYPQLNYDLGIDFQNLPLCPESGESTPTQDMIAAIERLKKENKDLINSQTLASFLPNVGDGKEIACTDIARSESAVGSQLLKIISDPYADANAPHSKNVILSNGGAVYASKNALYVSAQQSPYGWWWTSDFVFKDATVIHRFAISENVPAYSGSAEIDGHLLDNGFAGSRYSVRFSMAQFAMSEYDGYLRVATTKSDYTEKALNLDNRIVVLNVNDPSMTKVGEVSGMGAGEKIHAVRFIDDRGYVVTFKKTDPLYVVNLANPAAPVIEGELNVPGFSTYLHPLDGGHLIGLGFAAQDEGAFAWTQGLKIALFDVSDPKNPKEVGNREIGSRGSYSPAAEEHHAFTLDKNRGIISLPVEITEGGEGGSDFGEPSFSGVMLFKADLSGSFDPIGNISIDAGEDGVFMDQGDAPVATPPIGFYPSLVLRTIIIGEDGQDGVVTLTTFGVQVNRIDETMSEVGRTL